LSSKKASVQLRYHTTTNIKCLYKHVSFLTLPHFDIVISIIQSFNLVCLDKFIKLMSHIKHEGNLSTSSLVGTYVFYTNGSCKIGCTFTMMGCVGTWDGEEALIKPQYHYGRIERMVFIEMMRKLPCNCNTTMVGKPLRDSMTPFNLTIVR